jgi:hypothetical protein
LIAAYLEQRGIPYCDASPAFQASAQPEKLFLTNAAELSSEGHSLYAQELAAFLVRSVPGIWKREPEGSEASPPPRPIAERIRLDGGAGMRR